MSDAFARAIAAFTPELPLAVALSGGADSSALLLACAAKWPGQVGDQYLSRAMLEEMYQPWIELVKEGVGVHCGECGC